MNMEARSEHYSSERLNAAIDGEFSAVELDALEVHVRSCTACREEYSRLSETVEALRGLPAAGRAPEGLWDGIAARMDGAPIEAEEEVKILPLPTAERAKRRYSFSAQQLAAAAIVVALVSAGLVFSVIGGGQPALEAPTRVAGSVDGPAARAVSTAGTRYDEVVVELERILSEGRTVLTPETLEAIEASLATIETAIDEVQTALAEDPGSDMLARMLSAHQRTKLRVLQRAAEAVRTQI